RAADFAPLEPTPAGGPAAQSSPAPASADAGERIARQDFTASRNRDLLLPETQAAAQPAGIEPKGIALVPPNSAAVLSESRGGATATLSEPASGIGPTRPN